jgi:hypothetical protein
MTDVTADMTATANSELGTAADSAGDAHTPVRTHARIEGSRVLQVLRTEYAGSTAGIQQGRPSVVQTWQYAATGRQCPPTGPARTFMQAWALLAVPARTVLAFLDWALERPSRFPVLFALYAALAMTPYGSMLPWF